MRSAYFEIHTTKEHRLQFAASLPNGSEAGSNRRSGAIKKPLQAKRISKERSKQDQFVGEPRTEKQDTERSGDLSKFGAIVGNPFRT